MTTFTHDLYGIAVESEAQGRVVGRQILKALAEFPRHRGGGNVRVETSSQDGYDINVAFNRRNGFETVSRVSEFYRQDGDLLILDKCLPAGWRDFGEAYAELQGRLLGL